MLLVLTMVALLAGGPAHTIEAGKHNPVQTDATGFISGVGQQDERGQTTIDSHDGRVWVLRCDWRLHEVGTLDPKWLGRVDTWSHVVFNKNATQDDVDFVNQMIWYERNEVMMAKSRQFWPGLHPPTKTCYAL